MKLVRKRKKVKDLCYKYNQDVVELNKSILAELFGYSTYAYPKSLFFCYYGYNTAPITNFYANHNLVVLDCARVTIGNIVTI